MLWTIKRGNALTVLSLMPAESVQCVVTSPPYWGLRDYSVCDCAMRRNAGTEALAEAGTVSDGVSGQYLPSDARCRQEPDPNCRKCKGVGHIKQIKTSQLGLEKTPQEYLEKMVAVFGQVRRVLRADGTLWLNMGDCYASDWPCIRRSVMGAGSLENGKREVRPPRLGGELKSKDLVGMPWRLALALQADGWYLRSDIVWNKPNPMPESVTDRPTKSHEYIFLLTKNERYFYDAEAVKETCLNPQDDIRRISQATLDGKSTPTAERNGIRRKATRHGQHSRMQVDRDPYHLKYPTDRAAKNESFLDDLVTSRNKRSVWTMATSPFPKAHFATFPPELPEVYIKAGTSEKGCCSECGAPWQRVTEDVPTGREQKMPGGMATYEGGHGAIHRAGREQQSTYSEILKTKTVGWAPTCDCIDADETTNHGVQVQAGTIPCTVLDPFSGAGTTGLVATRLGRNFVGIELSEEYCRMSEERIVQDAPLFNVKEGERG